MVPRQVNTPDTMNPPREVKLALAGVAQGIELRPTNQRAVGSIPSQGTYLGCRPGPQLGAHKRQPHIDFFLHLFLSPFLSV